MGRKSVFHYLKRGKFAKVASLLHLGCHQGSNWTALNRYPVVFAAAAAAAPDARRILSFGCSTGEECVTLAEYFPKAEIIGADINPVNLLKARKHRRDRIRFVYASDRILSGLGGFDAIFCMSVLRSLGHYPFESFEERALFLETLVRPGGLLVITTRPTVSATRHANTPTRPSPSMRAESFLPAMRKSGHSSPMASPKLSWTAPYSASCLPGPRKAAMSLLI
jgi:chemotaxis methyl-accepting protein methylase